ncbi:glycosyl hydrolase [Mucilaginibacter myungsuensis]|uniref:Glycoside hydrolase family 2 n=1 Tax=Mucilaginibacter myungsuensis TaxID=649104 RepID=A0A929L1G3_9SPHI|nr:glycosyl hydrolase [Mucilaginibacter myungsuensis]MBE9663863.1 glycoside hydrolase family 2 [Mucilaginibacter myungsuensis]MDN3598422.1 glycosyl hydrolase [Mucilaginibacter myungsuensis]
MKLSRKIFTLALCSVAAISYNQTIAQLKKTASPMRSVETGFITAPADIQTSVYWYWISDNISKSGVVKDLESMKKVGINRAFIGNIGLDDTPYGKVKIFTDEWWQIMHLALKTATRLNIEIGIFNSPGWSQSGGPWVKPGQAMRYLASSEVLVKGPLAYKAKLAQPHKDFQDVQVIAYPVGDDFAADIFNLKPKVSISPELDGIEQVSDRNDATGIKFKNGKKYTLDIVTDGNYTARSVTITPTANPTRLEGDILAADADGTFKTIRHFNIDRTNRDLNVGFKPYGAGAISIPATSSKNFRIVFDKVQNGSGIAEVKISSTPMVEDYIEKTLAKMWQTPFPYWDAYQWKAQPVVDDQRLVIDHAKVIDISKFLTADGSLNWTVPAGNWVIERTGMTPTQVKNGPASPEGVGLEADKMSRKHIEAHFDAYLGEILRRIPAADRKTFKVTVQDSYETGGQNWTDSFIADFKTTYKYDPTPYIPVMQGKVVGSQDRSDRFLWDVRRLIADKVAYDYVGGLRDISHKHGLRTWLENYGHWGFPGEFLQYGGQSDEIGGEFWSVGMLGDIENRAASSAAHIYGKTKVSAESFTSGDPAFSRYPAKMKQRADRFFTEGINNTLMHVYIEQPDDAKVPGVNAGFGAEFNRNNTWFYDMDIFIKYLKRCNMMLQQGRYVADVAYFISEDAPKMTGGRDPEMPKGYSYDYINGEVIKTRLKVINGRLTLPDGLSYGVLVLPKLETIRPELLTKIKELVMQGAIVLGPRPSRSPSLANYGAADKQVQALAAELWGKVDGRSVKVNKYGKGLVMDGMTMQEALDHIKVKPDFISGSNDILYIHRKLTDGEAYFISNQKDAPAKFDARFKVNGMVPELWDPVTGSIRDLPAFTQSTDGTVVPMELDRTGSAFVIFRKKGKPTGAKENFPVATQTVKINSSWLVNFDPNMRGPKQTVKFTELMDWSKSPVDSIKYYSGSARYYQNFKLDKQAAGTKVFLDLGTVTAIAKVKVNGVDVGGVWTAPYKVDITKALKSGDNELEIKVTNSWVNRLIGDSKMPAEQRPTSLYHNPYRPNSGLQTSGLVGPVKLEVVKY